MVYGLEKFKEYFGDYTNQYVFIGGTACDILMNELGDSFRATKDLDIVLIIEALDYSFGEKFWKLEIDKEIEVDIRMFIEMIDQDRPDLKSLGIKGVSFDEMIELLENIYLKTSEAL